VPELLSEYLPIAVFFAIALGLAIALVAGSLILGNQRPDDEKMAAYECGFDAFDDSRRQFDVRFYLVAILFIIFDL
jgi:NADH-quinone oxidoreductase subunit A